MTCYTLSHCIFENITNGDPKKIFGEILSVFLDTTSNNKLIIDDKKRILEIYKKFTLIHKGINPWLEMVGLLNNWEIIKINQDTNNISNEEFVQLLCSKSRDKNLIVYSHNGWTSSLYCSSQHILSYNCLINVYDRDEAALILHKEKLLPYYITNIQIDSKDSIVTVNGTTNNSNNKSKIK